jgi:hypothetical protein
MTDLQLKGTHEGVKVDPIEKYCQEDLRVSLASIPRPGTFRGFSHLENDNIWAEVTVNLVQAGINFTALELLGAFGGKLEKEVGPGQCRRGKLMHWPKGAQNTGAAMYAHPCVGPFGRGDPFASIAGNI